MTDREELREALRAIRADIEVKHAAYDDGGMDRSDLRYWMIAIDAALQGEAQPVGTGEPSLLSQREEERLCECGAEGSGEEHTEWCPWMNSPWRIWDDAVRASTYIPAAVEFLRAGPALHKIRCEGQMMTREQIADALAAALSLPEPSGTTESEPKPDRAEFLLAENEKILKAPSEPVYPKLHSSVAQGGRAGEPPAEQKRRDGHSKLVYDKTTRTIVAVDPHPAPAPPQGREALVGRDIYECANQLAGYVGPDTSEKLVQFLLRESAAASALADEIVRLRTALATLPEPEGWQLVPVEPTQAMAYAAIEAIPMDKYTTIGTAKVRATLSSDECAAIYRAMLAASKDERAG